MTTNAPVATKSPPGQVVTLTTTAPVAKRYVGISDLAFIDPLHGWYFAQSCRDQPEQADYCDRPFNATTDGGQTWHVVGTTPRKVTRLRFANAQDGWAYDTNLYSTHDGGKTWAQDTKVADLVNVSPTVTGGTVQIRNLELLGGVVNAMVERCNPDPKGELHCTDVLRMSNDGGLTWQTSSAFVPRLELPVEFGKINASDGRSGWLLIRDYQSASPDSVHLSLTHDGGRTWQARPDLPCWAEDTTMLEGDGTGNIWLLCASQPGAGSQAKGLYMSADDGRHWELRSSDSQHGAVPQIGSPPGAIPRPGYAYAFAMTSTQHGWLPLGRGTLYETKDGGRTWAASLPMHGDGSNSGQVLFVDPEHGWWPTIGALYRTTDGGVHWDVPLVP